MDYEFREKVIKLDLGCLAEAGILRRKAEHEFGPVWRAEQVLTAVDEFAERAGRRRTG